MGLGLKSGVWEQGMERGNDVVLGTGHGCWFGKWGVVRGMERGNDIVLGMGLVEKVAWERGIGCGVE